MTNTVGSPGTDLRRYLYERGTLDAALACRVGAQIANGLAALHAKGILHGGMQPENVLLDQSVYPPSVRLTGFGTAPAGAPQYLAPEVIMGVAPDFRTDNYALGIVLYEMLCGTTPFAGMPPDAPMQARARMNPGRPHGIDDRLWDLITKVLRGDPAHRPADAAAIARQLNMLADSLAGTPQLPRLVTPPQPVPAAPTAPPYGYQPMAAPIAPRFGQPGLPAPMPAQFGHGTPPPPNASMRSPDFPRTQQSSNKNRTILLTVLAVLAIVAVAMVAIMGFGLRGWSPGSTSSTGKQTAAPSAQQTAARTPVRSAATGTAAPEPTATTPTTEPTQPTASAAGWPPEGSSLCDPWLAVNDVTSCSFAGNVASAYFTHGPGRLSVYSPVTGKWYDMSCSAVTGSIVKCTGGSNAVVYVRQ